MRTLFALLIVAATASFASASTVLGTIVQVETNIATFDPNTFGPGPNVDVFQLVVSNPHAGGATSVELAITGSFVNLNAGAALTFKAGTDLPTLGPNTVGESFFVVPDGFTAGDILGVNTSDDGSTLASSYTLPGTTPFVPGDGQAVLAVLSVETGSTTALALAQGTVGVVAIDGELHTLSFIPEPSTAILAMLGLVGVAARRRS